MALKTPETADIGATVTLIDACLKLDPGQLETSVPGTYGSILETMRHLVGADRSYLALLSGGIVVDEPLTINGQRPNFGSSLLNSGGSAKTSP